jgi:hypothetical protein
MAAHETITPHGHGHGHSNLETAELNLGHWGGLLHFSARSLCKPFHILEGRQVLFHLRIPATLVLADFWYNARRQKGPAIHSANMREGQRDELFRTGLHSVLEVSSLELLNQQSNLLWAYAVQYLLNLRTELKLYDHRHDCDQDENFI